jgi:hypothetical protein
MTGRKLEGTDADGDEEDEEFRLAIQASLAEMEKIRPTAPGEEEELEFKVNFCRWLCHTFVLLS